VSASDALACCVSHDPYGAVPGGRRGEDHMTQKQEQQQQDLSQIKPEAVELEDTQLEQAQGGILDGLSNRSGSGGTGTKGIRDGTSN
jgi:hypothetical protein